MKKLIRLSSLLIIQAAFVSLPLFGIGDLHFYRAQSIFTEPRFEKEWLASFDVTAGGGRTKHARDCFGHKTSLLNIYGLHAMQPLGNGVPKDPNSVTDIILTNLAQIPATNNFGKLLFTGSFSFQEFNLSYIQNFAYGFFAGAELPIKRLKLSDIDFRDCTQTACCPNNSIPQWQDFLDSFDRILQAHSLYICPVKKTGVGDLIVYTGWTVNYQGTEIIDFIDGTLKLGVNIPTSSTKSESSIFDIPLGYDKHAGIITTFDSSFGAYDWLTMGGHIEALIFFSKQKDLHMKTDLRQNGFIKLAQGAANVHKGPIWRLGVYSRADHVVRGFSCTLAYSYTRANPDKVIPCDTKLFDAAIVNSDEEFQGWNMHTLHFTAEYDFTTECMRVGPRLGIFYNVQVGGQRTFDADLGGAMFGVDVSICF
ncbi:MAG TPA: hypothetical protein VGT41_01930 [Candidatus Babeliales bacterium]|nr:hypothetical protein [Candidatus Babeliales bacterium]